MDNVRGEYRKVQAYRMANLRGRKDSTGKRKKQMMKQTAAPMLQPAKMRMRSHLDTERTLVVVRYALRMVRHEKQSVSKEQSEREGKNEGKGWIVARSGRSNWLVGTKAGAPT